MLWYFFFNLDGVIFNSITSPCSSDDIILKLFFSILIIFKANIFEEWTSFILQIKLPFLISNKLILPSLYPTKIYSFPLFSKALTGEVYCCILKFLISLPDSIWYIITFPLLSPKKRFSSETLVQLMSSIFCFNVEDILFLCSKFSKSNFKLCDDL